MKQFITLSLMLFCLTKALSAQDPGALLNLWSKRAPIEKVHLHLDRDNYAAGETIWFKAYMYSENLPDTISTVLYVELLNNQSVLLERKVLPVILGNTNGHITLPDSLSTGTFFLRAYSPTMLNQPSAFIYQQNLQVHGKKNAPAVAKKPVLQLTFFPEGGNLVPGVNNTLAFKANDENGMPVSVKGTIRNAKNEVITTFSVYHDGMGMAEFTPVRGEQYYAQADNGSPTDRHNLPALTDNAIAVTIIPHPSGFFFDVRQQAADPSKRVAFMLGQMQHRVVFRQEFKQQPDALEGLIDTKNLSSGIMHVTFFNKQGLPLAERLCFVNNREYIQEAELLTDTLSFTTRAKNRFSIRMKDTVQGSLSVSVTDADFAESGSGGHIASTLFLQSDLPGYIHHPGYYFTAQSDSVTTATDLLMMTHGWRRFKWPELENLVTAPLAYSDPGFITLSGKVTLRDSRKPLADKQVVLFISAGDTARKVETVMTDRQGNFKLDSLLFFGKSRVLYSDSRGKQSLFIDVEPGPDSLTRKYAGLGMVPFAPDANRSGADAQWMRAYEEILKENGLLLEGITLKVKKKSPLQQVEDEYTRGAFSGEARRSFDLVNGDEGDHYMTVYQYLEAKGVLPYNRNIPQASSMGSFSLTWYLDELPADIDPHLVPLNQVALIKVFTSFVGEWGGGAGGVIAIYTKKGETLKMGSIKGAVVNYPGFSIVKEFYAPDYKMPPLSNTPDNRITLDWRPDIFINNINPRIPFSFYNNDRTKRFRVTVQGMTATGKLVYIDRIIEPASKGF